VRRDISEWLQEMVLEHPQGRFPEERRRRLYGAPLLGVASGDDPLFTQFKTIIGPFHHLPSEALEAAIPGERCSPHQVSVVAYVLPIHERTRLANRRQRRFPHREWMLTKIYGELFNELLRRDLVRWIQRQGHRAVAPVLHGSFLQFPRPDGDITSNWSERHACFVAGLGTFGLSRGLITAVGKAVRVGTVVTNLPLEATPRNYKSPHEHCLFLTHGTCGRCISRCPAGAIAPAGQDKLACQAHQALALERRGPALRLGLHLTGLHLSCGLCQTGVPCEAEIPSAPSR
jgi:epoxyqueuosine reductase QueG